MKLRLPLVAKRVLASAIWTVIWLIIFNIFGVVVAFALEVFVAQSKPIFYGLWLVMGLFCGFASFTHCGALFFGATDKTWMKRAGAADMGFLVFCITGVVVGIILVLCGKYAWGGPGAVFVPDSEGLSMTYFVSTLVASGIAYRRLR